jgi:polysaccharide biosynthesis protein VpsQ
MRMILVRTFVIRTILILLPLSYMALIWLQTSFFDPESVSNLSSLISKQIILLIGITLELTHLIMFGLLYLLIIMVFLGFGELSKWKEYTAIIISFLYGVVDEIHQIAVPFRSASFVDLVKNTLGIIFIWWIVRKNYFRNENSMLGRLLRKITKVSC